MADLIFRHVVMTAVDPFVRSALSEMKYDVSRCTSLVAFVVLLILAGCRTYGDEGYASESKTYAAIQHSTQQLERHLSRAESDLRQLKSAAEQQDTLQVFVRQYESVVESHRSMLEHHKHQLADLTPDASYRTLRSSYGAIITDERLLTQNYRRTLRGIWAAVRDTTIPRIGTRMPSRYSVTPVQFPRVGRPGELTMADALRGSIGTPGLQRAEQEAGE